MIHKYPLTMRSYHATNHLPLNYQSIFSHTSSTLTKNQPQLVILFSKYLNTKRFFENRASRFDNGIVAYCDQISWQVRPPSTYTSSSRLLSRLLEAYLLYGLQGAQIPVPYINLQFVIEAYIPDSDTSANSTKPL